FLTFLILATGDLYKRKLVKLAGPSLADRRVTVEVMRAIDAQIERYLLVRLLISVIVAAATGIGLWAVGLADAAAWGVLAGVLNVIPFIGPTIAIVLVAAAALLQFQTLA